MKITKRQLRRMINEMYSEEGLTLVRLEQLTMAHQNLMNDIEMLFEEIGSYNHGVNDLRDEFTELLFPLFQHVEDGPGVPIS
jgi:hypothetical protein